MSHLLEHLGLCTIVKRLLSFKQIPLNKNYKIWMGFFLLNITFKLHVVGRGGGYFLYLISSLGDIHSRMVPWSFCRSSADIFWIYMPFVSQKHDAEPMLIQCWPWATIKSTLVERLVFAGMTALFTGGCDGRRWLSACYQARRVDPFLMRLGRGRDFCLDARLWFPADTRH